MQRYYVIDREMAAGEHGFDEMVARAYRAAYSRRRAEQFGRATRDHRP